MTITTQSSLLLRARTYVRAFAIASIALNGSLAHAAEVMKIKIDQAHIVGLPENTSTIVIGNPIVADVTMLRKNNQMIITGKSFGSTNMIALDPSGVVLQEAIIHVSAVVKGLIVQRGLERESYDCSSRCQPTINLGDSTRFVGETGGMIKAHNSLAGGK